MSNDKTSACGCPFTRGIIAGLVVGVYGWLAGGFVWMQVFANETAAFAHFWRAPTDPLMANWMIVMYLITGLFLSLLYAKFSPALIRCSNCRYRRGILFGVLLWLAFGFGEGLIWYTISPISFDLVYAIWFDKGLFLVGGGLLFSILYGNSLPAEGASCEVHPTAAKTTTPAVAPTAIKAAAAATTTKAVTKKPAKKAVVKKVAAKKKPATKAAPKTAKASSAAAKTVVKKATKPKAKRKTSPKAKAKKS